MQLLDDKPLFWKTLILLAVSTGAREGEIAGLEWKHVDFEKGTIRIEQAITEIKGKGVQIKEPEKTEQLVSQRNYLKC